MSENFYCEPENPKNTKNSVLSTLIVFALIIILAFISASLIKTYITETFTVDGSSMDYTLNGGVFGDYSDGDRVVVNRFGKLNRGSIIVLKLDGHTNALVKRIIGVEGDRIKIVDGVLYVNDEIQNEDYVSEENKIIYRPYSNMQEITVSQDCVFVLGDNRNGSSDSRDFGEIKTDCVEGKVFLILHENSTFKFI